MTQLVGCGVDVSLAYAGVEARRPAHTRAPRGQPRVCGGRGITGELLADTIRSAPRMRG